MKRLLVCVLLAVLLQTANYARAALPNVVVIFIDDMGYGDIEPFGSKINKTPHLNRMAREGRTLTSFYVASPVCTPSRAALMTGCYPQRVGLEKGSGHIVLFPGDHHGLHPDEITIAETLRAAGYATGCFGKWHLGDQPQFLPTAQGFDTYYGIPYSNDMWPMLKRFQCPHLPILADTRVVELVKTMDDQATLCRKFTDEATRFIRKHKDRPFFVYLPHAFVHGPRKASPRFMAEGKKVEQAQVEEVDWSVGQVLKTIREEGLADNTLVLFTSDNGPAGGLSSGPLRGRKGSAYEGGHRVPCFIHWPDGNLTGGRDFAQLSAHLDILPTLVDLCELQAPGNYRTDGLSLKPVLDGSVKNLGDRVLVESFNGIVMTKRWRHMRHPRFKKDPTFDSRLLYNMSIDPAQKNDVAKEHLEVVARLNVALERVNAENDNRQQRYVIGSDKQNPIEFTPSSWSERISVWQRGIRAGQPGAVPIFAEVEAPGAYRFSLRRWPKEMDAPIRSAPELTVPDGFEGKTKIERGRALPIVKARLKVPGFDKSVEVTDDMTEAVFTVNLKKGDCDILAQFIADDGKEYGAYFLSVERKD